MFKLLKKFFKKKEKEQFIDPLEDEFYQDVVTRCFKSGKVVIGNLNDDGSYDIKEIDIKE